MNKTSKKVLIAIVFFIAVIILSNTKAYAATNAKEAFENFKNTSYEKRYLEVNGHIYYGSLVKYLKPVFKFSDSRRAKWVKESDNWGYIEAIKEGCTDVTITVTYNGEVASKTFWLGVVKDAKTKYFKEFVNYKYNEFTIAIGEKFSIKPSGIQYYLTPKIRVANTNLEVKKVKSYDDKNYIQYIIGKKVGTTTVVVSFTHDGQTVEKKFKIYTKKINDVALQSSTNDVVSITSISRMKNQVLLANGELWNTDPNTFKLTTKAMGNVSKYVYTDIYFSTRDRSKPQAKNEPEFVTVMLKKDKTLTVTCDQKTLTAKNVEEASNYGFRLTNGYFYGITLVNGDLQFKRMATGVDKIFDQGLIGKNGILYSVYDGKISNEKVVQAVGHASYGWYLNTKGTLYGYYIDKNSKYCFEKVDDNVKSILNSNTYRKKDGTSVTKYLRYTDAYYNVEYPDFYVTPNYNLLLNGQKVLSNVVNVVYPYGKPNCYLIVKRDGSIWRLQLGGNYKFDRVRTGDNSAKRITKTGGLTATKLSNTQAKITWRKVEGAKQYTIYRSSTKDGKYAKIGTSTTTSYIDKTVKKGQRYYYKVVVNGPRALYDSVMSLPIAITI